MAYPLAVTYRSANAGDFASEEHDRITSHPKFNTFDNRGSTRYGRERLIEVLSQYEMWDELIQVSDSPYLPPDPDEQRANERWGWRAIAAIQTNQLEIANDAKTKLEGLAKQLDEQESQKLALIEKIKSEAVAKEPSNAEATAANQQDSSASDSVIADGVSSEPTSCEPPCEPPQAPPETSAPAISETSASETPDPKPPTAMELFGSPNAADLPQEIGKDWTPPPNDEHHNGPKNAKTRRKIYTISVIESKNCPTGRPPSVPTKRQRQGISRSSAAIASSPTGSPGVNSPGMAF